MMGTMGSRTALWTLWVTCLLVLALQVAWTTLAPPRANPWNDAETAVAGFVLSLFALSAGVGSFAIRETFLLRDLRRGALDPATPGGLARARRVLLALWALCLLIAVFGGIVAYGAASPRAAWPYQIAAGVLLVVHAPRSGLLRGREPEPQSA